MVEQPPTCAPVEILIQLAAHQPAHEGGRAFAGAGVAGRRCWRTWAVFFRPVLRESSLPRGAILELAAEALQAPEQHSAVVEALRGLLLQQGTKDLLQLRRQFDQP
jgi:hypothetical protein